MIFETCGAGVKRHMRAVIVVSVLVYCYVAYCLFYKSSAKNSHQSTVKSVNSWLIEMRNRTINDVFKEHHNQNQSFTRNIPGINEKPGMCDIF